MEWRHRNEQRIIERKCNGLYLLYDGCEGDLKMTVEIPTTYGLAVQQLIAEGRYRNEEELVVEGLHWSWRRRNCVKICRPGWMT